MGWCCHVLLLVAAAAAAAGTVYAVRMGWCCHSLLLVAAAGIDPQLPEGVSATLLLLLLRWQQ
jgi:hypothetical protein